MTTATAPQPTRATTSITISWGLLACPVSVYTATEETKVARKEFMNGNVDIPVGRSPIRKDTGAVIEADQVSRMAQASNGAWVVLTDDEIMQCTSPRGLAEIVAFVPNAKRNEYVTVGLNQIRPKRSGGKVDVAGERTFGLLMAALKARKVMALIKVAMRGPAKYCLLNAEGELFTVLTADAVRQPLELVKSHPSDAELAMALNLIDAVGVDAPTLIDDTAPVVQSFVDAKVGGAPAPAPAVAPTVGAVDLMSQLAASVEAAKVARGVAA